MQKIAFHYLKSRRAVELESNHNESKRTHIKKFIYRSPIQKFNNSQGSFDAVKEIQRSPDVVEGVVYEYSKFATMPDDVGVLSSYLGRRNGFYW